ncbi:hypothetical protein [Silvibacterium dinghuense]|uniref:Uncharacterized protein n=1 Tax=Silvibacterium dinghuense TaxID=1560006 RepID=A0A4Q1SE60_9BACT|nr:hypothetical protein [Silvibacterium dinghuense]RXS95208.1 hypothetical protein ESZ00_11430 [Silvibacterium dinghuense]GGH11541.1 hypothetical protein GCM10011586_30300 [Silvibacterium dinghuense]
MTDNAIPQAEIRSELERILASPLFLQSERLARFLRFTIEQTLQGEHASLKEAVIGTQVYDRRPTYNPSQDSIVRTEARRLRTKLKEYYEGEGRDNPVYIYFRPGSYVPVFRMRHSLEGNSTPRHEGISIAVIPFEPLSASSLASALALGISDELVHALMRTEGCRVVAASSIGQLVAQAADIPTLAQRLGAQVIFDGTVQQVDSRIRIHARLVDAEGARLWSQRFEVSAESPDLFEIQERVVSALMTRTGPRLSAVRAGAGLPPPEQMRFYPDLLAAEELLEEGTLTDLPRALQAFRRLAVLTPDYPRVHAGLAQNLVWLVQRGAVDSPQLVQEAQQAAEQAIRLDQDFADAHSALGCALTLQWRWNEAETAFRAALDLGRTHVVVRQYAAFLTLRGRFDEAWDCYLDCEKLDSFSHRFKASIAHFFFLSRRYQEGLDYFASVDRGGSLHRLHDALRYGTLPAETYACQALSLVQLGHREEALAMARALQQRFAYHALMQTVVAEIFALAGESAAAHTLRARIIASPGHPLPISGFRLASLALALGDQDEALNLLETAAKNREAELPLIGIDPRFDSLRPHERFRTLVTDIDG